MIATALRAQERPRESIFITTKIEAACLKDAEVIETVESTLARVRQNFAELRVPYADLMLNHAPCASSASNTAIWRGLQEAHRLGLARAIGVSNYGLDALEAAIGLGGVPPAINQVQLGLGSDKRAFADFHQKHGIVLQAYSPFASVNSDLESDERVSRMMRRHGKTVRQVALRYLIDRGYLVAVSPGTNASHMLEDLAVVDVGFQLSRAEVAELEEVRIGCDFVYCKFIVGETENSCAAAGRSAFPSCCCWDE